MVECRFAHSVYRVPGMMQSLFLVLLLTLLLVLANSNAPYMYVRKCCREDMAFDNGTCMTVDERLRLDHKFEVPKFVNASGIVGVYETNQFKIIYGKPDCDNYFLLEPSQDKDHTFQVSETGELHSNIESVAPDEFCLEQFAEKNFASSAIVCERNDNSIPTTTNTPLSIAVSELQSKSIDTGMIISLPFLFSTFLTYAFIKELRSSWHVKFQMSHVASLSMAYMIFIINKYLAPKMHQKNILCLVLAYAQQYFFIANFFWLNAMCFNIWWTLCEFKPISRNKQKEAKKFIKYSVYAWGCSLLISIITYFMDEIFSSSNFIRPEFGYNKCWFDKYPAKWMYFYGPVAILLFSDLLMFIHTSKILFEKEKIGQEYLKETESSGPRKYHKQNFILYLKLFIIMGCNWLAEIISVATNSDGILWIFVDIGNALQGVFIFIIFVCQKRVLTLLSQKLFSRSNHYNSQTTKNIIRNACLRTNTSIINEHSL